MKAFGVLAALVFCLGAGTGILGWALLRAGVSLPGQFLRALSPGQAAALAFGPDGAAYTTDGHRILKNDGILAGTPEPGFADGPAAGARFDRPAALVAGDVSLLVADFGNRRIRRVAEGRVSTLLRLDWPRTVGAVALKPPGEVFFLEQGPKGFRRVRSLEEALRIRRWLGAVLWVPLGLGALAAFAALWGRYRDLPLWCTGGCAGESPCQILFRTRNAALLFGIPNALLGLVLYGLIGAGLFLDWPTWPLLAGATAALLVSLKLSWSLLSQGLSCRICWLGHAANAALWAGMTARLLA